ncbi:MAG: hypothetical protein M3O91_06535, partial [Chloroflexota bacterium]|nr:hypothetical protein [Chloroflexota bacterium]
LLAVSGALAVVALWHWGAAIAGRAPVLYGEGAVAHASLLARAGAEYAGTASAAAAPIFTAANYPPLYLRVAGLGDPFVAGRVASVICTLCVAGAIAWRARSGGAVAALALSAAWIATAPVALWGPAVKPDLLALALTVIAVLVLERSNGGRALPGRASLAVERSRGRGAFPGDALLHVERSRGRGIAGGVAGGALLALAILAKPTAALPAVALAAWVLVLSGPMALARVVLGALAAGAVAVIVFPELAAPDAVLLHVVSWNALPWSAASAAQLVLVAALTAGVPVAFALVFRAARGPLGAYLVAAIAIVLLGGREGATINYILDLSAAAALALASVAARQRWRAWYPAAAAVQLLIGVAVLNPFGILPGRTPTTGAWGDPARADVIAALPAGPALVEDSGLLIAEGREPVVDDLFLWSRLVERGSLEARPLIDPVSRATFVAVVSQADLERLEGAPAFERSRWHPVLVREVLARYRLDASSSGLYVYLPR